MSKTRPASVYTAPCPAPAADRPPNAELGDLRFRKLLGAEAWHALPAAVRVRFSKRLGGAKAAVYSGEIIETRMSRAGWMLAQLVRIIGAPLPVSRDAGVPAVVTVTEDEKGGGQYWTRQYGRHKKFPQVIHSAKRFSGKTGLEEYVGCGIGMALAVDADEQAVFFRSVYYFFRIAGMRIILPTWLCPGRTTVSHVDLGQGMFGFNLELTHPWLGELICQHAIFRDA